MMTIEQEKEGIAMQPAREAKPRALDVVIAMQHVATTSCAWEVAMREVIVSDMEPLHARGLRTHFRNLSKLMDEMLAEMDERFPDQVQTSHGSLIRHVIETATTPLREQCESLQSEIAALVTERLNLQAGLALMQEAKEQWEKRAKELEQQLAEYEATLSRATDERDELAAGVVAEIRAQTSAAPAGPSKADKLIMLELMGGQCACGAGKRRCDSFCAVCGTKLSPELRRGLVSVENETTEDMEAYPSAYRAACAELGLQEPAQREQGGRPE